MARWSRATCIGVALLLGLGTVACGDERRDPDPIALIVALLEQPPADLPDGVSIRGEVESANYAFLSASLAGISVDLESGDLTHYTRISIYTAEDLARDESEQFAEDLKVEPPKDEGTASCYWDEDLVESLCAGWQGLTYIEIESYNEQGEGEASAADSKEIMEEATQLFDVLARHVAALERRATRKVSPVTGKGLGALVTNIAPAAAPDGTEFTEMVLPGDDGLLDQFEGQISVGWNADTEWTVWYSVFQDSQDARSYLNRFIGDSDVEQPDGSDAQCITSPGTKDQDDVWLCLEAVDETVVFSEHDDDDGELDDETVKLLEAAIEHLRTLRSGTLPEYAIEAATTPERTEPPSETRTPAATTPPEPTAPAGPSVVNAGTWTFTVTVSSNDCPGNDPAVGSGFTLEYVLTELGGDGMISNGEFVRIEQTLPGASDIGAFSFTLPTFELETPLTSGEYRGTGHLRLDFSGVDAAEVDYVEDWGFCTITADTRIRL